MRGKGSIQLNLERLFVLFFFWSLRNSDRQIDHLDVELDVFEPELVPRLLEQVIRTSGCGGPYLSAVLGAVVSGRIQSIHVFISPLR